MAELAMFPLGTVLFPSALLPLHVFEPRYRELTKACLAGDREFGVVLIERGSDVGGGDVRTGVGTVARIIEAVELDDGRWVLGTVGARRVRVERWLADDPFPRAEVDDWDDPEPADGAGERLAGVVARLRRVLALRTELGLPAAPVTIELTADPVLGSYQASAVAPLGPADQQRLLAAPTSEERVAMLGSMLDDEAAFLARQLAGG